MNNIEYKNEIRLYDCLKCGYKFFRDPSHPLANKLGEIYEHRHVASLKVGRWLSNKEHVHHIDGDKTNNNPNNLEVLSAREHVFKHRAPIETRKCEKCGKETINKRFCCVECFDQEKVPMTDDVLYDLIWSAPMVHIAEKLGISDVALNKKCKRQGIKTPPTGYWLSRNSGKSHEEALMQLEKNRNYKPAPPKFTREQVITIIEEIKKDFLSLRKIGKLVNVAHKSIIIIKKKLAAGKIKEIFDYYKAGEVPDNLK